MRLSTIWQLVHDWKHHRKHGRCLVHVVPEECGPCELAIAWAYAAARGDLVYLDDALVEVAE